MVTIVKVHGRNEVHKTASLRVSYVVDLRGFAKCFSVDARQYELAFNSAGLRSDDFLVSDCDFHIAVLGDDGEPYGVIYGKGGEINSDKIRISSISYLVGRREFSSFRSASNESRLTGLGIFPNVRFFKS